MSYDSIVVLKAPLDVDASCATSYFPAERNLTEWSDASREVAGKDRPEIPSETTIAVIVDVRQDDAGKPYMAVANATCGADSFQLPTGCINSEDVLSQYMGTIVAAAFTVGERIGDHSCHGSSYIIKPGLMLAVLPFNPTKAKLRSMRPGSKFVVQGRFLDYFELTPGMSTPDPDNIDTAGYLVIQTSSGSITLHSLRPMMKEPKYVDGVLENLRDKHLVPGEIIRVNGFITEKDYKTPAGVASIGYNAPFLLVPDPQRQAEYDALRAHVEEDFMLFQELLEVQEWQLARELFSEMRRIELTKDEARRLSAIMDDVPEEHRSVYDDYRGAIDSLLRAFGTNLETLNRDDFLAYARDILTGVKQNSPDRERRASQSDVFSFWESERSILSQESLFDLVSTTITVRLERLEQCSDSKDDYWDDFSLLRSCIEIISSMEAPDERLVQTIIDVVEHCLAKGYFKLLSDTQHCPKRFNHVLSTCFASIKRLKQRRALASDKVSSAILADWESRLVKAEADGRIVADVQAI